MDPSESMHITPTSQHPIGAIETDQISNSLVADAFHFALQSNNAWASYKGHQNPSFFEKAAAGQSPQIRESLDLFTRTTSAIDQGLLSGHCTPLNLC